MHANASHKHTWDSEFPNFSPALPGEKLPTCMDCPRRSPSLIFTKSCQIHKLRNTSTQITSTVPTACKGSFHKPPSTPKDGKQWGKKVKFETPGLQHSVGLNWRQAAWPGVLAGQLSNAPRPSIHFMSRFFHAGLGGQWKSTNADILAGFPVCIDFQLSFCRAWRCKAFMDLVCKIVTMVDWCSMMQQCFAVGLLGSGFMCFLSSMSIWAIGLQDEYTPIN